MGKDSWKLSKVYFIDGENIKGTTGVMNVDGEYKIYARKDTQSFFIISTKSGIVLPIQFKNIEDIITCSDYIESICKLLVLTKQGKRAVREYKKLVKQCIKEDNGYIEDKDIDDIAHFTDKSLWF